MSLEPWPALQVTLRQAASKARNRRKNSCALTLDEIWERGNRLGLSTPSESVQMVREDHEHI
jgi:hypothetical protein